MKTLWQVRRLICIFAIAYLISPVLGQDKEKPVHNFKITKLLQHTPVKNQHRSGTCWAFGTTSLIEAELMRLGKGQFDLSEMFVVRYVYPKKALNYIRYHGNATFGEGSMPKDWLDIVGESGIVPEQVYDGKNIAEKRHNHAEMSAILNSMLQSLAKQPKLTPRWPEAFSSVVTVYMGKIPEQFEYEGKIYTPPTFFQEVLQIRLNNYVELTSFTHHPFYCQFALEIPDNWAHHRHYYNIPIDEIEEIIDCAMEKGYTVGWDGDVSEKTFYRDEGYAVIAEKDWDDMTREEREAKKKEPEKEKNITQEMRQETFDNFTTGDDHLMHIVGLALNQNKTKFYYTKNSWGEDYGYKGYWYLSRAYVRLKTIAIMVHKDAIPQHIRDKVNIR